MAFTSTSAFKPVDVQEVSDNKTKEKNAAKAFMSWEVVNNDGTQILGDDGKPFLRSDKDIPFWQNPNFKSAAEDTLIELAKQFDEQYEKPLELVLRVKIKPYVPKERTPIEDIASRLGLFGTM